MATQYRPDIYYVLLDGCARQDVLGEFYDIDPEGFKDQLIQMGFFVGDQSRTNYSQTYLSVASSLNFNFLDEMTDLVGTESDDRAPLRRLIHDSHIVQLLKENGYLFITFATGMAYTEIKRADRYLSNRWSLSEFHNLLLNTTPVPGLINRLLSRSSDFQYDSHRSRILYTLEHLEEIALIEDPTFTFAHILACHPPFVFGRDGEEINPPRDYSLADANFFMTQGSREEYIRGYREQFYFVSQELEESIRDIFANSPQEPIIILQGDHGGGSMLHFGSLEKTNIRERMAILK